MLAPQRGADGRCQGRSTWRTGERILSSRLPRACNDHVCARICGHCIKTTLNLCTSRWCCHRIPPNLVGMSTTHDQPLELLLRALLSPADSDLPTATGMSCTQIAALAADPRAAELIQSLARVVETRARITAARSLVDSIAALEKIMAEAIQNPRHAETIRKAASGIIRLHESLTKRAAPHARSRPPSRSDAPDLPDPPGISSNLDPPDLELETAPTVTPFVAAWPPSEVHQPAARRGHTVARCAGQACEQPG